MELCTSKQIAVFVFAFLICNLIGYLGNMELLYFLLFTQTGCTASLIPVLCGLLAALIYYLGAVQK
jgi:hypothetical protein